MIATENTKHPCVLCNRLFGSEPALKQHQTDSPAHKQTFGCKVCDRAFGDEQALEQHQLDSPVHKRTVECKTCNRHFRSLSALGDHQRDSPKHKSRPQPPAAAPKDSNPPRPSPPGLTSERHPGNSSAPGTSSGISSSKPKRSKVPVREQETREYFMFPELHQCIMEAVAPEIASPWFYDNEHDNNSERKHATNIMGKFMCNYKACRKLSWGSKVVATLIRGYARNGYSAVVYNQRCLSCNHLGELIMDKDCYIERIAYRLKVWADVPAERPPYDDKTSDPHESDFCEGCKRGVCTRSNSHGPYTLD